MLAGKSMPLVPIDKLITRKRIWLGTEGKGLELEGDTVTVGQSAERFQHRRAMSAARREGPDAMDDYFTGASRNKLYKAGASAEAIAESVGTRPQERSGLGEIREKIAEHKLEVGRPRLRGQRTDWSNPVVLVCSNHLARPPARKPSHGAVILYAAGRGRGLGLRWQVLIGGAAN